MLSNVLDAVDAAHNWCDHIVFDQEVESSSRNRIGLGLLDALRDVGRSVLLLYRDGDPNRRHSACSALLRPMFEWYVRGLWILHVAEEEVIERGENTDPNWPKISVMISAIDHGSNTNVVTIWKKSYWKALNGYVHGGIHIYGRQNDGAAFEPRVSEVEMCEVAVFAELICLLAFFQSISYFFAPSSDMYEQTATYIKDLESHATRFADADRAPDTR